MGLTSKKVKTFDNMGVDLITYKTRNLALLLEEKDDTGATSFSFYIVYQLKL